MFSRRWFTTALTTSALGAVVALTSGFARQSSSEGGERTDVTNASGCCCGLACDCQDCGCDCGLEACGCESDACGCDSGACATIS